MTIHETRWEYVVLTTGGEVERFDHHHFYEIVKSTGQLLLWNTQAPSESKMFAAGEWVQIQRISTNTVKASDL